MRAFITGISGFVGAGLAKALVERGDEVYGLVRSQADLWRLEGIKDTLRLHIGDIGDKTSVEHALSSAKPSIVFHLASYGTYPGKQTDPLQILKTNVDGALNIFNAAEALNAYVVNAGTSSEYGTKDHPMREDELLEPHGYYAVSKAAQTLLGQYEARSRRVNVVTLRLFSVYGPFEEPGRYVPTVIANALAGKDVPISDPTIARDYIYLPDVVDAFIAAAEKRELSGEIINVGSGRQSTLGEVYDAVIKVTGSSSRSMIGAYDKRAVDSSMWVADVTKMKNKLNVTPRFSLAEGIADMVKWLPAYASRYTKEQTNNS